MPRRFRWTRSAYEHAHQLARLLSSLRDLPDEPPAILRHYWDLWALHRPERDPLSVPLWRRLAKFKCDDDGIPF